MTSEQARLLRFAIRYPNSWHSYAPSIYPVIRTLEAWGDLIEVNRETKHFRLALPHPEEAEG